MSHIDLEETRIELEEKIGRLHSRTSEVELVWCSEGWNAPSNPLSAYSVLDSSFNPPTLAHLSLALIPPIQVSDNSNPSSDTSSTVGYILLLSVRNVDKQLKKGDATHAQRLQMMILLAQEIESRLNSPSSSHSCSVAVAAIDEPTFAGKSRKLLQQLRDSQSPSDYHPSDPRLTFILGYDTIIRFFNLKYYGSHDNMVSIIQSFFNVDHSSLICARRSAPPNAAPDPITTTGTANNNDSSQDEELNFLSSNDVKPWMEAGKIRMVDIGEREAAMSSTLVRQTIGAANSTAGSSSESDGANNREVEGMVLDAILKYITEEGLYRPTV